MKHLIVTESSETIPISNDSENALSPNEADELSKYIRTAGLDEGLVRITRTNVTFVNYVGFIQLSSCSIEILPKVSGDNPIQSRKVLLRMLQRTGYLDIHESRMGILATEKMNFFDIIAYLYSTKLLQELNRGVYHAYRVQSDELPSVRGRINLVHQLRRAYSKSSAISCIYDEFHSDNVLNRFLKAAAIRAVTFSRHPETRKKASQALLYLDDVEDHLDICLTHKPFVFDRSNKRFQESWRTAQLILSQSAPLSAAGKTQNTSILFKMNDLFEVYVAYLTKKIVRDVIVKDRSYKLLIKEGTQRGAFQLEPDLLIRSTEGSNILMDTKWKKINSTIARHGVQREDFYQMYAYLTRYGNVGTVILLYPHHDGIAKHSGTCLESWHLEGCKDKRLKVYSLDYEDEYKALKDLSYILSCHS